MWVKNYMCNWVNTISPDKNLSDAVAQMVEKKTNSLIVVDADNKPVGIISSYSLIQTVVPEYLKEDPLYSQFGAEGTFDKYVVENKEKKVEEIMTRNFHALSVEDAMIEAASFSTEGVIRILPVVDAEGKLVGAITRTCIKNALYDAIFGKGRVKDIDQS